MKKIFNLLMCLAISGVAIMAISCNDGDPEPVNPPVKPDVPVKVGLTLAAADMQTSRAIDENAIQDVNIYLYGTMNYHFYFPTPELMSFEALPGDYEIFVITNVHENMGELAKTALQAYKVSYDAMVADIPMVANTNVQITSSTGVLPTIQVKRCAAKIAYAISVDDAVAATIKLESVQFCNIPKSTSLFGTNTASTNKDDFYDSNIIKINNAQAFSDTFYMFENNQGVVASITDPKDKIAANAPTCASYMRIYAQGEDRLIEYIVYLGENSTSDFNVRRNTKHNMNLAIKGENEIDNRVKVYEGLYYGKANCIICIGNRVDFDGTPYRTSVNNKYTYSGIYAGDDYVAKNAQLLWEDVKGLISDVTINNNIVTVTTSSERGNAGIALYDATGNILWSFHIWVLNEQPGILHFRQSTQNPNNFYQVLDRDLGAKEKVEAFTPGAYNFIGIGLSYQYGRKDPFPAINSTTRRPTKRYDASGNEISSGPANQVSPTEQDPVFGVCGTIGYATANPLKLFAQYNRSHWLQSGENIFMLWGNNNMILGNRTQNLYPDNKDIPKTIYDPCPEGYKVAPGDVFTALYNEIQYYDTNGNRQKFYYGQTAGFDESGSCNGNPSMGCWSSAARAANQLAYFSYTTNDLGTPLYEFCVSTGVRCVNEK